MVKEVNKGLSFSGALLKLALKIGKESGSNSEGLPETVEQAAILILTTLCFKVITEADHSIPPNLLDKTKIQACFVSACAYSVYAQLKKTNPEIALPDLIGKTGGALFRICGIEEERGRIVAEGFKMYQ